MSFNRVGGGFWASLTETGKAIGVVAESASQLHPDNHDHFMHSLAAIAFVGVLVALIGWVAVPGVLASQLIGAGVTGSLAMAMMVLAAHMRGVK